MRARRQVLSDLKRCPECRLHRTLCLCALIPRLVTRTKVVLVMHDLELRKPTNTGTLAARCLPNSSVLVRGRPRTVPTTCRISRALRSRLRRRCCCFRTRTRFRSIAGPVTPPP